MKLDAHQHFWRYSAAEYPWIPVGSALQNDWMPKDLAALQRPLGFDGSIAVQARQTVEESRWLLELADAAPTVRGVVGWVDLRSDGVDEILGELAAHPRFVGVRHVVQDEPDDCFLIGQEFVRGLRKLAAHGLTYDLLIYPHQLPAAIELVRMLPDQPFVLDHLAKPRIKAGEFSPWERHIRKLAESPNVWCKVSGLVTEADWLTWERTDFHPYFQVAMEAFGPKRLMYGSDWPVCQLAGNYQSVHDLVADAWPWLSTDELAAVWGGNCAAFYGITAGK